ncbi:D-lactonohydrolase-like protein [Cyathus striatus]|nr:D-lactonohydrolase-like protein [Cyathus striatus]
MGYFVSNYTSAGSVLTSPRQLLLPDTFAVLGENGTFRTPSQLFNPTSNTPPFFQVFDESFLSLLPGSKTFVKQIAVNTSFGFAFEAPIFNPGTNELFFSSSLVPPESSFTHNNRISKINMALVEAALASDSNNINIPFETLTLPDTVQITNGGTGPFRGSLLLATRGRGNLPSAVVLLNPKAPFNATVLVDNFFGRQFNSMNDIKIHPSGKIFFTDPSFGFLNMEKPAPQLPNQVYSLDPDTRLVRVVADQLQLPNGIAFNTNGKIAFVSDTGFLGAQFNVNTTGTSTIYAYDVDPDTLMFNNRRVFAYVDAGIPDGIQVDTQDNVYAATADGVQIFNKKGVLIGKVFVGSNVANMAFAGPDILVILANTSIFAASIKAKSNIIVS